WKHRKQVKYAEWASKDKKPKKPDPFGPVDTYIQDLMFHFGIRGAQVAIGRDGKLKTARAYTYAEAGYPDVHITDTIRLGSISKAITGTAATALEQTPNGNGLSLGAVQDILSATTFTGALPLNQALRGQGANPLRVSHLLAHTGGWKTFPNGLPYDWPA